MRLNVAYRFAPKQVSLRTQWVMDSFGIGFEQNAHVLARDLELDIRAGDVVCFVGPSGSGKSSLLRAAAGQRPPRLSPDTGATPSPPPTLATAEDARGAPLSPLGSGAGPLGRSGAGERGTGGERLRAGGDFLAASIDAISAPDVPLVDAIPLETQESLEILSACGLSEARLLLRTPAELSDGQRHRFRLAWTIAHVIDTLRRRGGAGGWIVADEFSATLDRTLARVLAHNLRRLADRLNRALLDPGVPPIGFLLATTHEDILPDLAPDLLVRCELDGRITATRSRDRTSQRSRPPISFHRELRITEGTKADWPAFAGWHYRNHRLAMVKRVTVLWHGDQRIGICVFCTPAAALGPRHRHFGLKSTNEHSSAGATPIPRRGTARSLYLKRINRELWLLSRVVLHPTYRGAGIAAWFVRESCRSCPVPWVETLSVMGRLNPFFERAGFVRAGVCEKPVRQRCFNPDGIFGKRPQRASLRRHTFSEPVYYVFDNRPALRTRTGRRLRAATADGGRETDYRTLGKTLDSSQSTP